MANGNTARSRDATGGKSPRSELGLIEDAIWDSAALSTHEKLVLHCLRSHTSDLELGCYPSQERIAEKTSMCVRQVRAVLKRMEKAGWIRVDRQRVNGGRYLVNVYYLGIPKWYRPPAHHAGGEDCDHRH